MEIEKPCNVCGVAKPATPHFFYPTSAVKKDGKRPLHSTCKPCWKARATDWAIRNKEHRAEYMRKWRAKDPEKNREVWRRWRAKNIDRVKTLLREKYLRNKDAWHHRGWVNRLKRDFNMTEEEYVDLYKEHGGLCGICGEPPVPGARQKRLAVDHDHKTNEVRGLAHIRCNAGLGALGDDLDVAIARLTAYRDRILARRAKRSAATNNLIVFPR